MTVSFHVDFLSCWFQEKGKGIEGDSGKKSRTKIILRKREHDRRRSDENKTTYFPLFLPNENFLEKFKLLIPSFVPLINASNFIRKKRS